MPKKEYLENICNEIMEFQRTGHYDLMYLKTKELGWKETQGIQNIGIEDQHNRPVTLEVEPEEEVDADEKGPYILQSEVEKAIKEMRNKNATGDDHVPGDVLKLFGKGGLKIMMKLINTIYETGQWPKDFT
jgi:hypothetical protein